MDSFFTSRISGIIKEIIFILFILMGAIGIFMNNNGGIMGPEHNMRKSGGPSGESWPGDRTNTDAYGRNYSSRSFTSATPTNCLSKFSKVFTAELLDSSAGRVHVAC